MTPDGAHRARPARARAASGHVSGERMRVSAIDVGSNSIRQVVADVSPRGAISVVDELKATPRLGAGVQATGALDDEAMRRALEALGRMATLARQLGVDRVAAVATSAVREAANGGEFVDRVRQDTGLELRLLDGREEARLAFRSAAAHFELAGRPAVVMDIGGGSLELALSAGGVIDQLLSYPLGAIRLTEQFLAEGGRRAVRRLRRAVRDALRDSLDARDWHGATLIGSGGTFTSLAAIHLERRGMTVARTVHGTAVAREQLEHVLDYLQQLTPAERAQVPGLSASRADIIVAGLAVAAEVAARIEAREVLVSAYGIREGLLLESAEVPEAPSDARRARDRSVRGFARRCGYDAAHARQVRRLALELFDAVGRDIGASRGERRTLADAALLHDVGYHVSFSRHHKHSYHLIVHANLLGVSPEEQVVLANIARYHRGAVPKRKHDQFAALQPSARARVRRLAALLRVADGLDRGHAGAVEHVSVTRAADGALEIGATPRDDAGDLALELWGAARKADLLADVARRPVRVVGEDGAPIQPDGA